ncbi:hypothetical protein HPB47_023057 [Ixodes persulcatus]|uniref:Uncharacterized protein n=1 Tax=Ixodes persulcatus TaxID=34615 RepID=A0AC60Q8G9_IXOPE|nr:hypothetical protein HPB47_023057 [Ixodes persulcatus]
MGMGMEWAWKHAKDAHRQLYFLLTLQFSSGTDLGLDPGFLDANLTGARDSINLDEIPFVNCSTTFNDKPPEKNTATVINQLHICHSGAATSSPALSYRQKTAHAPWIFSGHGSTPRMHIVNYFLLTLRLVSTALRVLSHSTATALRFPVEDHGWSKDFLTTAWFFEQVSKAGSYELDDASFYLRDLADLDVLPTVPTDSLLEEVELTVSHLEVNSFDYYCGGTEATSPPWSSLEAFSIPGFTAPGVDDQRRVEKMKKLDSYTLKDSQVV